MDKSQRLPGGRRMCLRKAPGASGAARSVCRLQGQSRKFTRLKTQTTVHPKKHEFILPFANLFKKLNWHQKQKTKNATAPSYKGWVSVPKGAPRLLARVWGQSLHKQCWEMGVHVQNDTAGLLPRTTYKHQQKMIKDLDVRASTVKLSEAGEIFMTLDLAKISSLFHKKQRQQKKK